MTRVPQVVGEADGVAYRRRLGNGCQQVDVGLGYHFRWPPQGVHARVPEHTADDQAQQADVGREPVDDFTDDHPGQGRAAIPLVRHHFISCPFVSTTCLGLRTFLPGCRRHRTQGTLDL